MARWSLMMLGGAAGVVLAVAVYTLQNPGWF